MSLFTARAMWAVLGSMALGKMQRMIQGLRPLRKELASVLCAAGKGRRLPGVLDGAFRRFRRY